MKLTRNRSGSAPGVVLGVLVVLALVICAGLLLNQARTRLTGRIVALEGKLALAQTQVEELRNEANTERTARTEAEAAAKEAGEAATQIREELQSKQESLNGRIQELETSIQGYEQRIAAADEATTKAEAELSRETELREAVEQEVADVRSQLEQQAAPGSPPDASNELAADATSTSVSAESPSSPPAATSAAKQSFAAKDTSTAASEAFDTPPRPVDLVSPEYPESLKQQRTQGNVVVAFTVDKRGRVKSVEVQESTNPEFEKSAVAAVRKWRFKPALRAGEPVQVRISQRLDFTHK